MAMKWKSSEIELGLAAGSISQPQPKCPKIENRLLSGAELRAQLEAHGELMRTSSDALAASPALEATATVYNAPPTTYATLPAPTPGIPVLDACLPPVFPAFLRCRSCPVFPL
ncbi:hypothetical protein EDD17DRAFT_556883 [Pisolithus thermaeus]|nr:hypothetical protein EDD17DRAFT_556883 [Pisolithus thermaeus]